LSTVPGVKFSEYGKVKAKVYGVGIVQSRQIGVYGREDRSIGLEL
jgi:hypothetical protein